MVRAVHPGDVVIAMFPFVEHDALKRRPAVVLAVIHGCYGCDVITAAVSSSIDRVDADTDVLLMSWRQAGLDKPSKVRANRIMTLQLSSVLHRIGALARDDWDALARAIRTRVLGSLGRDKR